MAWKLALHTGSIDRAPLDAALRVARETGWDAVELRHVDFKRALEAGQSIEDVLALVNANGLPVTAVGVERGWLYAEGEERQRLLASIAEVCRWVTELDAPIVMSPVDANPGDLDHAAASVREVGDIVGASGKTLALELNVGTTQFRTLGQVRELLARAQHPSVGLLVDTYHIERGEGGLRTYQDLAPGEIAYFQYSDVPNAPMAPPVNTFDRLPPGQGVVPFAEILAILREKGYDGPLSYEALNLAAAERDPSDVAREALEASRRLG
jgi:4-hydroxyphenylpyruvate dioxygenase